MMKGIKSELEKVWPHLLAAVLLAQLGSLFFIAFVPLQVIYYQRGLQTYSWSMGIVLVVSGLGIGMVNSLTSSDGIQGIVNVSLMLWLGIGLWVCTWVQKRTHRHLFGLLTGGIVGVVLATAAVGIASGQEVFTTWWSTQVDAVGKALQSMNSLDLEMNQLLKEGGLVSFFSDLIVHSFGTIYFLLLLSIVMIARRTGVNPRQSKTKIKDFTIPENFLWLFLGSWIPVLTLIIMERFGQRVSLGIFDGLVSFFANVTLLIYALQGLGIILAFMEKKKVSILFQTLIKIGLFLLFLRPETSTLVSIGLSLLGVSENWIKYRLILRSQE